MSIIGPDGREIKGSVGKKKENTEIKVYEKYVVVLTRTRGQFLIPEKDWNKVKGIMASSKFLDMEKYGYGGVAVSDIVGRDFKEDKSGMATFMLKTEPELRREYEFVLKDRSSRYPDKYIDIEELQRLHALYKSQKKI